MRSLDSGAYPKFRWECGRFLSLPCRLERQVLLFRAQTQLSSCGFAARTLATMGTSSTGASRKTDKDGVIAKTILTGFQLIAHFTLRTPPSTAFPVEANFRVVLPLIGNGLLVTLRAHRTVKVAPLLARISPNNSATRKALIHKRGLRNRTG